MRHHTFNDLASVGFRAAQLLHKNLIPFSSRPGIVKSLLLSSDSQDGDAPRTRLAGTGQAGQ